MLFQAILALILIRSGYFTLHVDTTLLESKVFEKNVLHNFKFRPGPRSTRKVSSIGECCGTPKTPHSMVCVEHYGNPFYIFDKRLRTT